MSMFHFQDRHLQLCDGADITEYPCHCKILIKFGPEDAFGVQSCSSRTTLKIDEEHGYDLDLNKGLMK